MSLLVSEVVNAQLGESSGGKATPPRTVGVMGLYLTDYHALVAVGDTIPYEVGFIPANATDQSYTIHDDSDGTLIEVDSGGILTAKEVGTTTLTFTSKDGGYVAVLVVEIKAALKPVTSIQIDQPVQQLHVNDVLKLSASYLPVDAERVNIVWSSSDTTVATVSEDGLVIARKLGDFTITVTAVGATAADDKTGTWVSKVVEPPQAVTGVDLTIDKDTIWSNETAKLTVDVKPANAANKDYTFVMSPTGKASIDKATGVVTPQIDFDGALTITVKTDDGSFTDSVTLTVNLYVAVQSVAFQEANKEINLAVLNTHTSQVTVLPANSSNDGLQFHSADPLVASVDLNTGVITGNKMADVVITVSSVDKPTITDTLTVHVVDNPVLIHDYKPTSSTLTVTGTDNAWIVDGAQDDSATHLLNLTVVPSTGTYANPSVTVTSGTDVVTVTNIDHANQRFTFTGLKVGTANIRLQSGTVGVDRVVTNITVNITHGVVAVTGVEITDGDSINVNLSTGTKQLTAVVSPAGATDKTVAWSTSDSAVMTVSNAGLVTLKKGGSATLTVTTTDGGFTDNILVNVTDDVNIPVTGVTITEGAATSFNWDGTAGTNQLHAVVAPAGATNKAVNWTVTPAGVFTINATTGVLSLIKDGSATATVTTADGSFTASCVVAVVDKRAVTITTPTISDKTYHDGGKYQLALTKVPADGKVTGTWDTTDHTVATIDANGLLTCLKAGSFGISWTGTDAAGNARSDNSGGGTVSSTASISVSTPSLRDIPAGATAQMRYTSPSSAVIAADPNLKMVYSTTAPAATATIDPDTGIITAKVKDATQYSFKCELHCGSVVGDNDSSGTYIVDALTSFAAALPASPPAGVTLTGNTLTFANLAGNTANGVTLTLNPTPSTSSVGWITATSAAVSKCTVTDPNPNPGSQGAKQTIVIKPVAVDTTGTKVTVTAFGKTLELTVITSAA